MSDREYEEWRAKKAEEQARQAEARAAERAQDEAVRNPATEIFGGAGAIEMDAEGGEPVEVEQVEATPVSKEQQQAHDDAIEKRNDAVWYAVVGVAMLFMGSFHWGVAVGGVFMVFYGALQYLRWNAKAKAAYDPWDDPEIDAWEEKEWGS